MSKRGAHRVHQKTFYGIGEDEEERHEYTSDEHRYFHLHQASYSLQEVVGRLQKVIHHEQDQGAKKAILRLQGKVSSALNYAISLQNKYAEE